MKYKKPPAHATAVVDAVKSIHADAISVTKWTEIEQRTGMNIKL